MFYRIFLGLRGACSGQRHEMRRSKELSTNLEHADGLRARGVDVVTSFDSTSELDDSELLDRTAELGRVLFTRDFDLLREATKRQRNEVPFLGVIYIYAHQLRVAIGTCIRDLEIIAIAEEPDDLENGVEYLPL